MTCLFFPKLFPLYLSCLCFKHLSGRSSSRECEIDFQCLHAASLLHIISLCTVSMCRILSSSYSGVMHDIFPQYVTNPSDLFRIKFFFQMNLNVITICKLIFSLHSSSCTSTSVQRNVLNDHGQPGKSRHPTV